MKQEKGRKKDQKGAYCSLRLGEIFFGGEGCVSFQDQTHGRRIPFVKGSPTIAFLVELYSRIKQRQLETGLEMREREDRAC